MASLANVFLTFPCAFVDKGEGGSILGVNLMLIGGLFYENQSFKVAIVNFFSCNVDRFCFIIGVWCHRLMPS